MIGEAGSVVKPRDIAVITLMEATQAKEIRWRRICGGASFLLPESGVEIVAFADDDAFAGITC